MCHNHLIADNRFGKRYVASMNGRTAAQDPICAIGGHASSSSSPSGNGVHPYERHNSFHIRGNTICGGVYVTAGISPNKGPINLYRLRDVWVGENSFVDCSGTYRVTSGYADDRPDQHLYGSTNQGTLSPGGG
jgi:hypothetical protein